MMVEDLGVEAKEAAVREVAKLLPLPELLQSISSIKADYIARQQVRRLALQLQLQSELYWLRNIACTKIRVITDRGWV